MTEVTDIARTYADRCQTERIPCRSMWRRPQEVPGIGGKEAEA
jgi:UDP-sulfoquinovose synthase